MGGLGAQPPKNLPLLVVTSGRIAIYAGMVRDDGRALAADDPLGIQPILS
jgi:hypothetical protein